MSLAQFFLIFVLIALNGFFVGVEFAVIASRRTRLDLLAPPQSATSQLVHTWLADDAARDRLIAATQLGITLVSLALGAVGEKAFASLLEPFFHELDLPPSLAFINIIFPAIPLFVSLTIVTSLHVVLGEQVPKVAVLRSPEQYALFMAPAMNIFSNVFRGFINLLDGATRLVLQLAGLPASGASHSSVGSLEELREIVSSPEVEGMIAPPEQDMLTGVINFSEMLVRDVIVPRTELAAVDADTPVIEAALLATQRGVTKLPVYEVSLDQVVGVFFLRDLLPLLLAPCDKRPEEMRVRDVMREALFVPETASVNDLLVQFRSRRQHIAIVMDEYGGTAGLVTLDDLLEVIVGEVQDTFDATPPSVQIRPDGSALIDGLTPLEEVNQYFGLELVTPDYHTIAGFILDRLRRIPNTGDIVQDAENKVTLQVESMDNLRVERILLTRSETGE